MKKASDLKKIILISGVPGTGKTTISKLLSKKLNYKLLELNKIVTKSCILYYDKNFNSKVVDLKKLEKKVKKNIKNSKKGLVIEGHLACELKLKADFIIIFRLEPKILKKRLLLRGYKKEKIKQNLEAEILDYCTIKAEQNYSTKKIFEFNLTNKTKKQILFLLLKLIKFGKYKKEKINWTNYLLEENLSEAFL